MIDLNAQIIPGKLAAGICIRQSIDELLSQQTPAIIKNLDGAVRYEFGPVWVWTRNNLIDQIGLFQGYKGALSEGIGVGAQMLDVKKNIGNIFEDEEDNLCVVDSPGWCFETSRWNNSQGPDTNLSATIVGIFVFAEPEDLE